MRPPQHRQQGGTLQEGARLHGDACEGRFCRLPSSVPLAREDCKGSERPAEALVALSMSRNWLRRRAGWCGV